MSFFSSSSIAIHLTSAKTKRTACDTPSPSHSAEARLRYGSHIRRLQSFRTLDQIEFDLRAFGERAKALALDRAEVNENVLSALGGDEAIALRIVEPLHGTGVTHSCHSPGCVVNEY